MHEVEVISDPAGHSHETPFIKPKNKIFKKKEKDYFLIKSSKQMYQLYLKK